MKTTIVFSDLEDLVDIKIEEDDGSVSSKKITMNNLAEIFRIQESRKYYLHGQLFRNPKIEEYVEGMIFGESTEKRCKGIFFIPGEVRCMKIAGEKIMIPYPSLIFAIKAKDGCRKVSYCFAVKEKKIDDIRMDTKLFAYPFGNVQPSDGKICWGSNILPPLNDFKNLQGAITIFYSSASNSDYVRPGKSYSASYGNYMQFLKGLTELEKFPVKALVKSPAFRTFNELFVSL